MSITPAQALRPNDEVLGYLLKYPIGSGGYGEVWAADAPGGIAKAVKFVYGFHDDERAQRELKALSRIKQLRHPFLISLERIDVVDGRLVIISELADRCLREEFVEFRDKGEQGIPRELLLSYLSNVAEALDYLTADHSLQHLDIKPENLLVVGNHVKVADFGLVKNVHDVNQSMMDGLTPTYAAPELFDGKPSRNSDQYSLAIVYQELLTGTRPFTGTTAAQLASQHVGSRPNLKSLPASDQAVIARALAKDHDKRYPTCRSMIEDLVRRKVKAKKRHKPAGHMLDGIATGSMTQAIDPTRENQTEQIDAQLLHSQTEAEIEKLSALEVNEAESTLRPTIFIGIGQSGGKVLSEIKGQLASRVENLESVEAFQFLYLDTDRRAIFQSTSKGHGESLEDTETFEMRLRPPEEYRASKKDFSWLSRRWLFNVPRSLQTEGLRPLGRLALADHFDNAYERIAEAVRKANNQEAMMSTAETLGLKPTELIPQVFIVTSIAGGTGSGVTLDVTHAVRTILSEEGIPEERIFGVFLHSTDKDISAQRLAVANTYSFLSEYNHFCLNGYKGDNTIDLPTYDPGPIYKGIYFNHLGNGLNETEYQNRLDSIAQYLFLSTATRCNAFFEAVREDNEDVGLMLRTIGYASGGGGIGGIVQQTSLGLAEKLIEFWKDECATDSAELSKFAEESLAQSGFKSEAIQLRWAKIEQRHWRSGINSIISELATEMINECRKDSRLCSNALGKYLARLDALAGDPENEDKDSLSFVLESKVNSIANEIYESLESSILGLINKPAVRVAGAMQVSGLATALLESYEKTLNSHLTHLGQNNNELRQKLASALTGKMLFSEEVVDELNQVARQVAFARLQMTTCKATIRLVRRIQYLLTQNHGHINDLSRQLVLVIESFREACGSSAIDNMNEHGESRDLFGSHVVKIIQKQFKPMVAKADWLFNNLDLEGFDGLLGLIDDRSAWLRQLPRYVKTICQRLIVQELRGIQVDKVISEACLDYDEVGSWIDSMLIEARPSIIEYGGSTRMMIGIPEDSSSAEICDVIAERANHEATVVKGTFGDCVFCYEVKDVPLDSLAINMIDMRADCAELVRRLHVRGDIEWTSLTPHG